MAVNLRFSTGVEALLLLAIAPEKFRTSRSLAEVLHSNPVVVRRVLSALCHAGIIVSAKGPSGGSRLARSPKQITLRDVYRALATGDLLHCNPHAAAETKGMLKAMHGTFRKAEKALERELERTTLHQLIKKSGKGATAMRGEPDGSGEVGVSSPALRKIEAEGASVRPDQTCRL